MRFGDVDPIVPGSFSHDLSFPVARFTGYVGGKLPGNQQSTLGCLSGFAPRSLRKGQRVGPKEEKGNRKGKRRDANIIFGMEGKGARTTASLSASARS
jgi:hypothetical protein